MVTLQNNIALQLNSQKAGTISSESGGVQRVSKDKSPTTAHKGKKKQTDPSQPNLSLGYVWT